MVAAVAWRRAARVRGHMAAIVSAVADGGGPATAPQPKSSDIMIVHFNDVYNIEERSREPVGGAPRFIGAVEQLRRERKAQGLLDPLVLFSGDAFNPSTMSTVTGGKQMPPVLNLLGVHTALMGNHDFDFGVDRLKMLVEMCEFPWLLSNVRDKATGRPLADGAEFRVFEHGGWTIGLIGIVELEWLATLATIEEDDVDAEDPVACANRLAATLRGPEHRCDLVIALTHARVPNDVKFCHEFVGVDIVLGGHDHHYEVREVGGRLLCKSGTDFREFTVVTLTPPSAAEAEAEPRDGGGGAAAAAVAPPTRWKAAHRRVEITKAVAPHAEAAAVVEGFHALVAQKMEKVIGNANVRLDCRFCEIRTKETNVSNWVADIMADGTSSEVALLNSGTLRADALMDTGAFRMRDLVALLPMPDALAVLSLTGAALLQALENGVSMYPRLEGRFPCVSGVRFAFDPSKAPGARIDRASVTVRGSALEDAREYRVVTKEYLTLGKDGYKSLVPGYDDGEGAKCRMLVDGEEAPVLPTLVRNRFTILRVVNVLNAGGSIRRTPSVEQLPRLACGTRLAALLSGDGPSGAAPSPMKKLAARLQLKLQSARARIAQHSWEDSEEGGGGGGDGGQQQEKKANYGVECAVEGRIRCIEG